MGGFDKAKDNVEPVATMSITSYEAWDYARLKRLEMMGIMAQRDMRKAATMTPEAIVSFIHQLSPWNLKTTGIAMLEAYADTRGSDLASNNPEASAELSNPPKESL